MTQAQSPESPTPDPIAQQIFDLLAARGPGKSICPSEAARAMQAAHGKAKDPAEAWRRYLAPVRQQALHLARRGEILILRKGKPVDPHKPVKGVIRLALPQGEADGSGA
ncbi:MAG: DUF3253 domain-containing protein [Kiloniellales bacterium]|nr:DUF3253 domain-containing protein [Kiloniellales bacterium]